MTRTESLIWSVIVLAVLGWAVVTFVVPSLAGFMAWWRGTWPAAQAAWRGMAPAGRQALALLAVVGMLVAWRAR